MLSWLLFTLQLGDRDRAEHATACLAGGDRVRCCSFFIFIMMLLLFLLLLLLFGLGASTPAFDEDEETAGEVGGEVDNDEQ